MQPPGFDRWRRFAGRCGPLLVLALAAGCGGQGTVTGQVLYNGKPVRGGWVTFRPADAGKNTVNAPLDADGNFTATLPAGEVRIAVDNRELEDQAADRRTAPTLPPELKLPPGVKPGGEPPPPAQKTAPPKSHGLYVPIPEKYYDVDTSNLTYTVKTGVQAHNIELK